MRLKFCSQKRNFCCCCKRQEETPEKSRGGWSLQVCKTDFICFDFVCFCGNRVAEFLAWVTRAFSLYSLIHTVNNRGQVCGFFMPRYHENMRQGGLVVAHGWRLELLHPA
jgi:hypothetical protein